MSHIIPWNVHGALFAGTLGLATLEWALVTFFAWVTPLVTVLMIRVYFLHRDRLPTNADAEEVYAKTAEPTAPQLLA